LGRERVVFPRPGKKRKKKMGGKDAQSKPERSGAIN